MFEAALDGEFKGLYIEGEDIAQSDPNTQHVTAALQAMECIIVQDLFLNESAKFAHVFLPGSSFLEKDGTFTNAERRISRVRKVMEPKSGYADWQITQLLANALGYPMNYAHPSEIMDEIARLTPTFTGRELRAARRARQHPVALQRGASGRHADHAHRRASCAARASSWSPSTCRPHEKVNARYPLILTTGRILSQYNVGAQTRRTENNPLARRGPASRSTRTTPRSAASATATGSASPAAPATPCCARASPSACSPAWSTPPSTSRNPAPTSSPPRIPTGPRTAPSTRSPPCRRPGSTQPSDWQRRFRKFTETQEALLKSAGADVFAASRRCHERFASIWCRWRTTSAISFAPKQKREDAIAGIANHIDKFWTPRMREKLIAYLEQHRDNGLDELPREALKSLAQRSAGKPARAPKADAG